MTKKKCKCKVPSEVTGEFLYLPSIDRPSDWNHSTRRMLIFREVCPKCGIVKMEKRFHGFEYKIAKQRFYGEIVVREILSVLEPPKKLKLSKKIFFEKLKTKFWRN